MTELENEIIRWGKLLFDRRLRHDDRGELPPGGVALAQRLDGMPCAMPAGRPLLLHRRLLRREVPGELRRCLDAGRHL